MVSKTLTAGIVSAGTIAAFTWLGQFTLGLFEDANTAFDAATSGRGYSIEKTISESDMARLRGISEEISSASEALSDQ